MSGHAPDELVDGVLGDLLPDLDQGISELLDRNCLHTLATRPGIVLHQEEPRAHCTSVRSDNRSEDFIPVPNSSQGTVGYDMETLSRLSHVLCEPALICEENGAPMADLPILVFSHECQSSCTVLGCEHRSH
ncbi:hypothetical protein SKAU_G00159890 [Synaphobranchus kaupii]|uniref:Uncharacterized protein n=1 Tax=Synaphobranchus kaupii TaxID=118154 RepID=A0A9Q1FIA7_SYNKA|nr:hypothetical protein SKAU_G00159890 [Synaphobranchus kaupii]